MTAYSMTLENEPRWIPGQIFTVAAVYTLADSVASADTFVATDMLPAQKVKVITGHWQGELDTNASPTATLIIGDGTDTDGYLASKVAGDATGQIKLAFDGALLGTENAASRTVTATLGGTVGTAASSGDVRLVVTYECSNGDRIS